ncbi:hypothetical protein DPMN_025074 [Dreissena polymorpha]|uniref:Uncharacterized protein n=1 Tax=Dreissena polymorpha TaxID=45954 RepID=A0A9D4RBC4_DREPO|nr:hypothetical protein DPMN_025074 [Dreissena polymorpha]
MAAQQHTFETISKDFEKIRAENKSLCDEVVDLKARSMRNNLLVFNFDEENTFDDRKHENCTNKIHEFCEKDLAMSGARILYASIAHTESEITKRALNVQ